MQTLIEIATESQNRLDQYAVALSNTAAKAAKDLADMFASHSAELLAKDAEITTLTDAVTALEAIKAEMVLRVTEALQSGDPVKFQEVAVYFLTPEQEKIKAEKLAQAASLEAQAAAIKAELGVA